VRDRLKDDVPIRGSETGSPQGRQAQRVRGIVAEIEATAERQILVFGIGETGSPGVDETRAFARIDGLWMELSGRGQVFKWGGHRLPR
jgi:hypothetical protein